MTVMNTLKSSRRFLRHGVVVGVLMSIAVSTSANAATPHALLGPCPVVVAHRGGTAGLDVENSPANWLASLNAGVRFIEADIRFTSDNVPIVMHDSTVDRTTNGHGSVSSMTAAEISQLTLHNDTPVPLFSHLISDVSNSGGFLMFEPKQRVTVEQWLIIQSLLDSAQMKKKSIVESLSQVTIAEAHQRGFFTTHIYRKRIVNSWALSHADAQMNEASLTTVNQVKAALGASFFVYEEKIGLDYENGTWSNVLQAQVQAIVTDNPVGLMNWEVGRCRQADAASLFNKRVPRVTGMSVYQAKKVLQLSGFNNVVVHDQDSWAAAVTDKQGNRANERVRIADLPANGYQSPDTQIVLVVTN